MRLAKSLIIQLAGVSGRNLVIGCLERHYGASGLLFGHLLRTKQSSEAIILPHVPNAKLFASLSRYRRRGACTFAISCGKSNSVSFDCRGSETSLIKYLFSASEAIRAMG